jgi:hypothetical protein
MTAGITSAPVLAPAAQPFADSTVIFDFGLTGEEIAQLDALDQTGATGNAQERTWW